MTIDINKLDQPIEVIIVDQDGVQTELELPRALVEATLLSQRKAQDYNAAVGRSAYFPMGLPSYAQEIYKKGLRLVNLAKTGKDPANESVRDTALDIINYACFLVEAIDNGELK